MSRESYRRRLADLRERVVEMADRRDNAVDRYCEQAGEAVVRDLITREHGDLPEARMEASPDVVSIVLLMIRDLERVGDQTVNIAARTLYMEESNDALIY